MDTAPRPTLRRPELVPAVPDQAVAAEPARALAVMVTYQLSEAGRKGSLLAGGDGKQLQQLQIQVPASRLHLVSVDPQGHARLKLRPRFHEDAEHRIVRTDAVPIYDAPPSLDDLFREAARNHELERVYLAERNAARDKRRDTERERRDTIARTFLDDKAQRALVHPAPSPKRCTLKTSQGRLIFDLATDEGLARQVPPEAHRRFRADLAAKKEKNLKERAAQLALHEEKKRYISAWIAEHGTEDQKERQAAGMLPMHEVIEAISEECLRPLARLRAWRPSQGAHYGDGSDAKNVTAQEWRLLCRIGEVLPRADVRVRLRRPMNASVPAEPACHTIVVTLREGPLLLRKEYVLRSQAPWDAL